MAILIIGFVLGAFRQVIVDYLILWCTSKVSMSHYIYGFTDVVANAYGYYYHCIIMSHPWKAKLTQGREGELGKAGQVTSCGSKNCMKNISSSLSMAFCGRDCIL